MLTWSFGPLVQGPRGCVRRHVDTCGATRLCGCTSLRSSRSFRSLYIYIHIYICITYIHMYIYIHAHTYMYTHVHTDIYIYIHIYIYTERERETYTYIRLHIYMYIHTHIYTFIHVLTRIFQPGSAHGGGGGEGCIGMEGGLISLIYAEFLGNPQNKCWAQWVLFI